MKYPFAYTTINKLRGEDVAVSDLDDIRAKDTIKLMSLYINNLTDQWFAPQEDVVKVDGNGTSTLFLKNLIPILKVKSLSIDGYTLEDDEYQIDWRCIKLLEGRFRKGRLNVEINGTFGWLENQKEHGTVLISDMAAGNNEAVLDSVDGFDFHDVVDFVDNNGYGVRVIVNEIDRASKKLKFDSLTEQESVNAGSKVITYGCVPRLIERACTLLAINNMDKINSSQWQDKRFKQFLKRETTDKYSWEVFQEAAGIGQITSDPIIDEILGNFCAPPTFDYI